MNQFEKTIVTACDHRFLWGAMLLGLSLRYHNVPCYYHVLGYDLPEEDIKALQAIPHTKVFQTAKTSSRSVCTQKPMAIATAETELIIWMDADCMVTGNVDKYLVCQDNAFQIRFREKAENASVYRNFYRAEDTWGEIPPCVLDQWKKDINDLQTPNISTVSQTNCFVLNKEHLPFIKLWQRQMEAVIPENTEGVYAKDSVAYSMTDESVINSLFAFSSKTPITTEYLLDKDPNAYCAHFGLYPKPWQHWTRQSLKYYQQIQDILHWAHGQKMLSIGLPPAFLPGNKTNELIMAYIRALYSQTRYKTSTILRKLLRHFR